MTMEPSSVYEKLDSSLKQIRLIQLTSRRTSQKIRCKIQTFDLESCPRYKALSYAWGPSEDRQQIFVNGHSVVIQRNLYDFLQVFQERKDRGLIWIDQLCIDQSSIREKNHQVGFMDIIYARAWATFIWLGPDPNSGLAFAAIRRCACDEDDPEETKLKWSSLVTQPEKEAFYAMLSEPYWTRHWVAQEIGSSSRDTTIMLYGSDTLSFSHFMCLYQNGSGAGADFLENSPATRLLEIYNEREVEDGFGGEIGFWIVWTHFASESFCQNPKDKVFGLQKTFRRELQIAVDYALSVEDVFTATVACWYDQEFSCEDLASVDWHYVLTGCYLLAAGMGFSVLRDDVVPKDEIEEIFEHLRMKPHMNREAVQSIMTWEALNSVLEKYLLGDRTKLQDQQ